MNKPFKWENYLHLVEFAYNNGCQEFMNMIPFEELYGKKWNTLLSRDNLADRVINGLELLKDMEE